MQELHPINLSLPNTCRKSRWFGVCLADKGGAAGTLAPTPLPYCESPGPKLIVREPINTPLFTFVHVPESSRIPEAVMSHIVLKQNGTGRQNGTSVN